MELEEFINKYDFEGSIVLLEGKRIVIDSDKAKLIKLGSLLAEKSNYITFRSGNADGADSYFAQGVTSIDSSRFEVITPYSGHRKNKEYDFTTYSLDEINLVNEPEVIYQSKRNNKTEKLIDKFVEGEKNRITLKAAYIIRDTIKVLGTSDIKPANFAIFYEDLENPNKGGTGHTMDICRINGVEFINQLIWLNWVEK